MNIDELMIARVHSLYKRGLISNTQLGWLVGDIQLKGYRQALAYHMSRIPNLRTMITTKV